MANKKEKHVKMDRYLIALHDPQELNNAARKMRKEGYDVHSDDIKKTGEELGTHSRRKIYNRIRETVSKLPTEQKEPTSH